MREGAVPVAAEDLPLLVVDDEEEQRRAIARLLAPTGWEAVVVAGGEEALAELERRPFAVVVSDFHMPGMDGVTLLQRVRELRPEAERILVTGAADADALARGVNEAGISRFVRKPWEPPALLRVLEDAQEVAVLRREHAALVAELAARNAALAEANRRLGERAEARERRLAAERRRWDVALAAVTDPILVVGKDLRVQAANLAAARRAGANSGAALEGRPCHEALFGRATPCPGCPIAAGAGRPQDAAGKAFDARAYRLPGEPAATLVIYRDVMAAVGELAGAVADKINNPLHAMMSAVQLARAPDAPPERIPIWLARIQESALRCRDVIDEIRELARHAPKREGDG